VGYLAGSHIGTIYGYITRYSYYALIALGVILVALIARHLMRRRRARQQRAPAPAATPTPRNDERASLGDTGRTAGGPAVGDPPLPPRGDRREAPP
jgi:hypothetical protein